MTANELSIRLDGRRVGREFHAFCPIHRGKSRSLHFRDGDTGGVVIKCRAGCDTGAVLKSVGLSWDDISNNQRREPLPQIARVAQAEAVSSLSRNLPADVRQQSITVIYTDEAHVDEAIVRALALVAVNREIVQIALKGKP